MLGQTINHYKITAKLGEGGMGAVYRATDTRLGREVALKILPARFVRDRQRMARFQREAEVLASLNHPHINIVHGLEESGEVRALVLELVEGPTLGERIAAGPVPVEEALRMALEIAQALEEAHEKGIIHRDLKPANVKIAPEGTVKVLDFGLAKALEPQLSEQELAKSPTLTLEATQEGIVLGTAAYMSPEQARGQVVDKRTDIWSFGLVLFEMLTGQGLYAGKSFTETLAAVIHQEPSLDQLPKDTPWKIRELLERCLRKDHKMRLRDMGDARITIQECLAGSPTTLKKELLSPPVQPLWRRLGPWAMVPLLGVVAWSFRSDPPAPEKPVTRFEIPLAEDQVLFHVNRHGLALSPDGTQLAFVSQSWEDDSSRRIQIRSLDQWETTPVPASDKMWQPFFSPDGNWLGFYWAPGPRANRSEWTLKKFSVERGAATTICDCPFSFGASWGADDIFFACKPRGGLWRVSASGGEPEPLTELDQEAGEVSHRLPRVLPDGKTVLFTVLRDEDSAVDWSRAQIAVYSLETGERKSLIEGGSDGRYVPTGHLVFMREATLMAASFDLGDLEVTGPSIPVLEGVSHAIYSGATIWETGVGQFAFSASGSLAYIGGSVAPEPKRELVWVDREGDAEAIGAETLNYLSVRLSPDGSKVALNTRYKSRDIWIYDLVRGARTRDTFSGGLNYYPIWNPDGTAIVFSSDREGVRNLFYKSIDAGGEAKRLLPRQHRQNPSSWHPDGTKLAFVQLEPETSGDIWVLSTKGSPSAEAFVQAPSYESHPEFSPDGHWMAYVSDESGREEVYIKPYPGPGRKQTISTNGGSVPTWAKGGKELFYRSGDGKMMAVEIGIEGNHLTPGNPEELFDTREYGLNITPIRGYDVSPDGGRFLMTRADQAERHRQIQEYYGNKVNIVLNWFEELERLVPTED